MRATWSKNQTLKSLYIPGDATASPLFIVFGESRRVMYYRSRPYGLSRQSTDVDGAAESMVIVLTCRNSAYTLYNHGDCDCNTYTARLGVLLFHVRLEQTILPPTVDIIYKLPRVFARQENGEYLEFSAIYGTFYYHGAISHDGVITLSNKIVYGSKLVRDAAFNVKLHQSITTGAPFALGFNFKSANTCCIRTLCAALEIQPPASISVCDPQTLIRRKLVLEPSDALAVGREQQQYA